MATHEAEVREAAQALYLAMSEWFYAEFPTGLANEHRDVALRLRDSITYRLSAVVFHHGLIVRAVDGANQLHRERNEKDAWRGVLALAETQVQYFFDDLVFNAISMFDHISCLVGLLTEGLDNYKGDWRKALGRLKSPSFPPETRKVFIQAHKAFVAGLLRYRSGVAHFERDRVSGSVVMDLAGAKPDEVRVSLPHKFAELVRGIELKAEAKRRRFDDDRSDLQVIHASDEVTSGSGETALQLLEALTGAIELLPYSGPATTQWMYATRLRRAGAWSSITGHAHLRGRGVTRVGAVHVGGMLTPKVTMSDGTQIEGGPVPLKEFFERDEPMQSFVEAVVRSVQTALDDHAAMPD